MTEEEYGKIVDADVVGDEVVYTALSDGGVSVVKGKLTINIGPYTVLADSAMEDMAEQLIGMKIEFPEQDTLDKDICHK